MGTTNVGANSCLNNRTQRLSALSPTAYDLTVKKKIMSRPNCTAILYVGLNQPYYSAPLPCRLVGQKFMGVPGRSFFKVQTTTHGRLSPGSPLMSAPHSPVRRVTHPTICPPHTRAGLEQEPTEFPGVGPQSAVASPIGRISFPPRVAGCKRGPSGAPGGTYSSGRLERRVCAPRPVVRRSLVQTYRQAHSPEGVGHTARGSAPPPLPQEPSRPRYTFSRASMGVRHSDRSAVMELIANFPPPDGVVFSRPTQEPPSSVSACSIRWRSAPQTGHCRPVEANLEFLSCACSR